MKSVLIIEDEPAIREAITDILQAQWPDIIIYEAANGAVGIETAILHQPDLIITDGNLPILTGFQLVLLLREMKSVAHIPLVAMTAAVTTNPAVRLMIEACDAYLPKPFDIDIFLKVVTQFLG